MSEALGRFLDCRPVYPQSVALGMQRCLASVDIFLIGCGDKQMSPLGDCDMAIEKYGFCFKVPVFIGEG